MVLAVGWLVACLQVTLHSSGVVTGGRVTTYLLEKTRVARQLEGERSYHVFYQLCEGADSHLREKLGLKKAVDFRSLVRLCKHTNI